LRQVGTTAFHTPPIPGLVLHDLFKDQRTATSQEQILKANSHRRLQNQPDTIGCHMESVHLGPTSEIFCHQKAGNFTAWEILHFDDLPSLAEPSYSCPFTDGFPIFSQLYQAISLHFSSFLWGFPSILPGSAGISPDFRLSQELGQRLTGAQQLKRQQTQQLLRHVQSEDRQTPIASMISYEKYSLKIWSIEK